MTTQNSLQLFPLTLKRLRKSRGLLQKTFAINMGLDATVLCTAEKGSRAPLDETVIEKMIEVFALSSEEADAIKWTAHHDRLIWALRQKSASDTEIEFLSTGLRVFRHLKADQIKGLISNLQHIGESASLVASLDKSNISVGVAMT